METERPQTFRSAPGRARRAEVYSGGAMLALCLGIGLVVFFAGADPYVPRPVWLGSLLVCLTSLSLAASGGWTMRARHISYATAVVAAWTLVIGMPSQGMLVVIMVVVAAVGSYLVPIWAVAAVIVLNTVVVGAQAVIHGAELIDAVVAPIFYLFIHIAAVFSTYALWKETQLRAELEQKNVELTAASVLLEDSAKTSERLRISRELHDLIGHQLTVLNLELEAAKHVPAEQTGQHLERAGTVAKDLLADVRTTVGELRAADHGDLTEAITRVAAAVPSLEIYIEVDDDVVVDEQQSAVLVRAAQEIMTNTVRHAEARELQIRVSRDEQGVRLTGVNDGMTTGSVVPGHGLTGLRERVEELDGELHLRPQKQFTVEVVLPHRNEPTAGSGDARAGAGGTGGAG